MQNADGLQPSPSENPIADNGQRVPDEVAIRTAPSREGDVMSEEHSESVRGQVAVTDQAGGLHAEAEVRFQEWMRKERKWVGLFMKFGVKLTLMDAIMELLDAPFKATQFRRNLAKYTGFQSIPYISCRGHMLITKAFNELDGAVGDIAEIQCDICQAKREKSDYIIFEYLPLLPRLKAWVGNEESCKTLFQHHQMRCREYQATRQEQTDGKMFHDFVDGALFEKIARDGGGSGSTEYDLFIAPSCDGFEPYQKGGYTCWPVTALNHNLPPSQRFMMKNTIPLGVIQGPSEPKEVHTWFKPLREEIDKINANGGTLMRFFDGVERRVRVHVIFVTGDEPAVNKMAGLKGRNSKNPCRYCNVKGVWSPFHSRVYFPSRCKVTVASIDAQNGFKIAAGSERTENRTIYDPFNPSMRTKDEIDIVLCNLDDDSGLSNAEKKKITDNSGLKGRTELLKLHSVVPYISFPPDVMHKFMNICHDLFDIFKGKCLHLTTNLLDNEDKFVLSASQWNSIDQEMDSIKHGTSSSVFPEVPRNTKFATHWKAVECVEFLTNYALIIFEGRLPLKYLKNLRLLCNIVELCRRPSLSNNYVERLKQLGGEFVQGFESLYYRNNPRRVGVCKSTIHSLVHLGWAVEQCGPPVYYSQFWVERYIGDIKGNLHATTRAAEPLNENSKSAVRVNLYYQKHFEQKKEEDATDRSARTEWEENGVQLLTLFDRESLSDSYYRAKKTKRLLKDFIRKAEGMGEEEAEKAVKDKEVWCFGRIRVPCGEGKQVLGARDARRHRQTMLRSDFYISAEFYASNDDDDDRLVYYGRVLKFLRYTFHVRSREKTYAVVLMDWCSDVRMDSLNQVYCADRKDKVFKDATIEDVSVVFKGIGVVEHQSPSFTGTRTYFMDPSRDVCALLEPEKLGLDGIKRTLVSK